MSEGHVRENLEKRYANRGKSLARAALRFVDPSRKHADAPIRIGDRVIEGEVIAAIPKDVQLLELEEDELIEAYANVEVELHAQDIDRHKQGWAGVVKEITPKRLRFHLYPTIDPREIYTKSRIRADILLVSRHNESGDYQPYMFHLVKVLD